ncbi:UDP-N-acetylglucosamine 2-epimerase (non-hydrolysing) [Arachidicoccus rhizosphaerae]|uniref:UDP-N-acetylglucosamine 2-epimerase (non-hydrolyzing) n=2 Tax=Arachidicoccus rhizosphaerae TaxID=551991 RepID=A0A1H4AF01_9BACT|nr:UDP-N-acetylglucosamine 2-epimerase (non-hydrolysing) [Arachidicoccus rhizosphaerae]
MQYIGMQVLASNVHVRLFFSNFILFIMKPKILLAFGTRPEAIKMAPLAIMFQNLHESFEMRICVTGQHREMLDQIMQFFELSAHYDLNVMRPGQNLFSLTSRIINDMRPVLEDFKPDYVFVHGDTTTSTAVALAAFYSGCKVAHVEAGLRTFDKWAPFPEEMNRNLTSKLADIHFAPTRLARKNLLNEAINPASIAVTGNTVIDALHLGLEIIDNRPSEYIDKLKGVIDLQKPVILVTGHRRENHGDGFLHICAALREVALTEDVNIIYPVHLNPNVQKPVYELLSDLPNVLLIEPQPYESFIWLMSIATVIITDSGGVQEEAPALGKPVLVMRDTTERPEAVDAGTVILVGTHQKKIVDCTRELLHDKELRLSYSAISNPYGDGHASEKIIQFLFPDAYNAYLKKKLTRIAD